MDIDHERGRCGDPGGAAVRGGGADRQAAVGQELSHAGPLLHCPQGCAGLVLHRAMALVTPGSPRLAVCSSQHYIACKTHPAPPALFDCNIARHPSSLDSVGRDGGGGAHSMAGRANAGPQVQAPQGDAPVRIRLAADGLPAPSRGCCGACVVGEAGAPPDTTSAGRGRSAAWQAVALAALGLVDQWGFGRRGRLFMSGRVGWVEAALSAVLWCVWSCGGLWATEQAKP